MPQTAAGKTEVFEHMPVKKAVLLQIVPAILSQMVALIYNLADTYFVGLLHDPAQTAAITVSYPAFLMLTAVSNLFGVGGASAAAAALGSKDREKAGQISAVSFWGGLLSGCLFALFFAWAARPLLTLCGATAAIYPAASSYAKWAVVIGGPFTILNTVLANLVRAKGSSFWASAGVSLGGFLNILLDPLFVLPRFLGLGAEGAGIATAAGNLCSTLFFLAYITHIRKQEGILSIHPRYLRHASAQLRQILSAGFPSALQYALTVAAVAAQSKFVSAYPTEAVAALGIVKKLDQLPLYVSIGISNGLLPLLSYTHAAGKHDRRIQAFRFGASISLSFSALCLIVYECFATSLVGLFLKDTATIFYGARFLRIMVTAMPLMALCYPMIIQFQAMRQTKEALICSILRKGVLDIPLLFLMDRLLPLYGCMWVQPIVDAVSLAIAVRFHRKIRGRL